ncbi:ATP-binding protein [Tepidibacillus infernus]|uniref:histidine kinase n=1 Tax=Tepidibacillus decaturensis TaxID=1413211 RepID=A0A135L1T1_9BACI|nr:ATP-binding protein [Tepidibacillus decaturensis]KXG42958.1 hypothetical protein U473_02135 [Tepidibacillus decaturensis]
MFKKLARRLMFSYLTVIFIALVVLGGLLSYLFENYYFIEKERRLKTHGEEVSRVVESYFEGKLDIYGMNKALENYEHHLNAQLVLFDRNGEKFEKLRLYEHAQKEDPFTKEEWNQVLDDKTVARKDIGYLNFYKDTVLSVAVPIKNNGQVTGAVSLHSTIYDIRETMLQVRKFIILAGLIAMAIATLLTYWLSKRISQPLKQMSKAASELAVGKSTDPIHVDGNDEIAQLAHTFNTMAKELATTEQVRRDFIANVSHELRSPLTYICGVLQGINDRKFTEDPIAMENYVSAALTKTKGMSRLIQDLLDLSRMEAKTFQLFKTKMDLNETIRRLLAQLDPILDKKSLSLKVQLKDRPIWINADIDRIEQVLTNLLDNAIKFTPVAGIIKVKTTIEKNYARVEITDSGPGIPKEELPFIWERFYKVDKVRTPGSEGTGLGLAIVKRLILAHEGQIEVQSEVNKGTTFIFTLPVID